MQANLCCLLISALLSTNASAWGRKGHETVGYIASTLIQGSNAEKAVAQRLRPGESPATAAKWPDCAKDYSYCQAQPTKEMQSFANANPYHHGYHYTDVPFHQAHYANDAIGTTPDDIVHILLDAILVLQGKASTATPHTMTKRQALFVLAHMTGDIHQPLHVGAAYVGANMQFQIPKSGAAAVRSSTPGGNWLCVISKGLHSLWDSAYVDKP